jgi:hypothetical protein
MQYYAKFHDGEKIEKNPNPEPMHTGQLSMKNPSRYSYKKPYQSGLQLHRSKKYVH